MVQNILSAMDAEEVSSISDTIESMQVAEEVRTTYFENMGNFELKGRFELVSLEALVDPTDYPHVLKVPTNIDHFKWIKYNAGTLLEPNYQNVCFLTPEKFLEHVFNTTDDTRILVRDFNSNLPYFVNATKHPTYWTTFDNEHIIFDSFNSTVEATLQASKVMVFAEVIPVFLLEDSFVPDLEAKFFPMLLAEAKSAAFINYKGVSSSKEEQRSRRQLVRHQNNRGRFNEDKANPRINFGRR
jgi:hypothetical protein